MHMQHLMEFSHDNSKQSFQQKAFQGEILFSKISFQLTTVTGKGHVLSSSSSSSSLINNKNNNNKKNDKGPRSAIRKKPKRKSTTTKPFSGKGYKLI